MDFAFGESEERRREEMQSFLRDNLPELLAGGDATLRPRTDREFERAPNRLLTAVADDIHLIAIEILDVERPRPT